MEAFPLKLLGWFHRVSPKTKHTSAGAGPRSPSTAAWQMQTLPLANGNTFQRELRAGAGEHDC